MITNLTHSRNSSSFFDGRAIQANRERIFNMRAPWSTVGWFGYNVFCHVEDPVEINLVANSIWIPREIMHVYFRSINVIWSDTEVFKLFKSLHQITNRIWWMCRLKSKTVVVMWGCLIESTTYMLVSEISYCFKSTTSQILTNSLTVLIIYTIAHLSSTDLYGSFWKTELTRS
jgi:hypothetical protein